MTEHEYSFVPDDSSRNAQRAINVAAAEGFGQYVSRELEGAQLFGAIASRLLQTRPDEVRTHTEIAGGKVGLEVEKILGARLPRLSNPDAPLVQDIYYPDVALPGRLHALLSEVVFYKNGLESPILTRIPWLYIVSPAVLANFKRDQVAYLSDVATESYCRIQLDPTGISEGEPAFAEAHAAFFRGPINAQQRKEIEHDRLALVQDQDRYLARLQAIGAFVLN